MARVRFLGGVRDFSPVSRLVLGPSSGQNKPNMEKSNAEIVTGRTNTRGLSKKSKRKILQDYTASHPQRQ
jgi:hypothetical protein